MKNGDIVRLEPRGGRPPAHTRGHEYAQISDILSTRLQCRWHSSFAHHFGLQLQAPLPGTPDDVTAATWLWFNFCRWRVIQTMRAAPVRLRRGDVHHAALWHRRATRMRSALILVNGGLAVRVASQRMRRIPDQAVQLDDLIAVARMSLVNAVDLFDASRGYKFAPYACRAIARDIAHHMDDHKRQTRAELRGVVDDLPAESDDEESPRTQLMALFDRADLSPDERWALRSKFRLRGVVVGAVRGIPGVSRDDLATAALAKLRGAARG